MSAEGLRQAQRLMAEDGVAQQAIDVFSHYYQTLESGETGLIAESDIEPIDALPRLADLSVDESDARAALSATAVIKLNGGLGTSMGLDRAKSLLEARDGHTFLDLMVRQVLALRRRYDIALPLLFMNSFRTRDDTLEALEAYPELPVDGLPLDFLQSREPKLRSDDLTPVSWPADPSLEWCPPGHGDLYPSLQTSGILDRLIAAGYRYAFVSNSDNLGARPDPRIAGWFAGLGAPFASESCRRTPADSKGGHLAVRRSDGRLVLRESAQTAEADKAAFADTARHRFFNANNLWLDLRVLADTLRERNGVLGLPMIRNVKTVDPSDPASPEVIQIETAMGAAVEVFEGAAAIEVDRSRLLPVKTTSDLLVLRSDAYDVDEDSAVHLVEGRTDAPLVQLGGAYKLIEQFDARFPAGVPSLREARALRVPGDWTFGKGVSAHGDAVLGTADDGGTVPDGARIGPAGVEG